MPGMNAILEYQSETDPTHAELGAARRRVAELENELSRLRGESLPHGQSSPFTEMRLFEVEGLLVKQAMDRFQGNVSRAARALGLSRTALYRRLERHKI